MRFLKRSLFFCLAMILFCGAFPLFTNAQQSSPFTDISSHWARQDILWAFENGIASGVSETRFAPNSTLTRAMFVAFLQRTAQLGGEKEQSAPVDGNPFADVAETDWYYAPLIWAYSNGILAGTGSRRSSDGKVRAVISPNDYITREQTAAILHRFLTQHYTLCLSDFSLHTFPDQHKIAPWAKTQAQQLGAISILMGDQYGNFNPKAQADRGSAVSLCKRVYELLFPQNLLTDADGLPYDGTGIYRRFALTQCLQQPISCNSAAVSRCVFANMGLGRLHLEATLQPGAYFTVQDDADSLQMRIGLDDGLSHTYDYFRLESGMTLLFIDGTEVSRTGDDYILAEDFSTAASVFLNGAGTLTQAKVFGYRDESPFAVHGALHTDGSYIVDEHQNKVYLQGYHQFLAQNPSYLRYDTFKYVRDTQGISVIRIGVLIDTPYPGDTCWCTTDDAGRAFLENQIDQAVRYCEKLGLYCVIDWHGLDEWKNNMDRADPNIYHDEAVAFFDRISDRYADRAHVLYEIYNEPLSGRDAYVPEGMTGEEYAWERILLFANDVIPTIRKNAPDSVVLVPTPTACQKIASLWQYVLRDNRLPYPNLVFTVHIYSGLHFGFLASNAVMVMKTCQVPVFFSEWGFEYLDDEEGRVESSIKAENLVAFFEKHKISNCFFMLHPVYSIPKSLASCNWELEELPRKGQIAAHMFRRIAGLE